MNKLHISLFLFLLIAAPCFGQVSERGEVRETYRNLEINYQEITGLEQVPDSVRRDPSDVIKVGDTYYVYYTKFLGHQGAYRAGSI